jgi:putative membrane protein
MSMRSMIMNHIDKSPARSKWWQTGARPDYRFSLANERTFLAWIRTALAMIAGAIGIDEFASHVGSSQVRLLLSLVLFWAAAMLGGGAYRRWVSAERAMRHEVDLPLNLLLPFLTILTSAMAVSLAVLLVIGLS